jgi:hypothetical protein
MARGNIFSNQNIKEEMLSLREHGYPYVDLARKYNCIHTTIIYHCRKAGLVLKEKDREKLYDLVKKGMSASEVAKEMHIPSTVVDFYCFRYGVRGEKLLSRTRVTLEPIVQRPPRSPRKTKQIFQAIKVDEDGVEWKKDYAGKWICSGRSEKQKKSDIINEKKRMLQIKRLKMLTY